MKITKSELMVLQMLAGKRAVEGGAWVNACLGSLHGSGLITNYVGQAPHLTEKGREALAAGAASTEARPTSAAPSGATAEGRQREDTR